MTDALLKDYEVIDTKFAGLLSAADLGDDTIICFMKQYKYRGEMREKVTYYYYPTSVRHTATTTEVNARDRPANYYYRSWYDLRPQDQVIVMRKVKS